MAFNQLGNAAREGEGIAKDANLESKYKIQTLNRMLWSCWASVGKHMLEEVQKAPPGKYDLEAVRQVMRPITAWTAALGSREAGDLLSELQRPTNSPPIAVGTADFRDTPPWLE